MPRVALTVEQKREYMLADLPYWFEKEANKQKMHHKDLAEALGITPQAWNGRKKRKPNGKPKDPFSYGELLILFQLLGTEEHDRLKLLTL